jgi:hypothetical protein
MQMLVLEHEIDLDGVENAPWLAEMPREPGTGHGQGMVEDHQLVAFAALGGDVPSFERSAIVRRDGTLQATDRSGLGPAHGRNDEHGGAYGYESAAQFSREYKQYFGRAPSDDLPGRGNTLKGIDDRAVRGKAI